MAAPAWRSVGTAASVTNTAATPGMPSGHTLDDILITATEADAAADAVGTDADYPHITGSPLIGQGTEMGVGWKRHDGSEAGPTWPAVVNHQHAICFAISGALATGTPFDILSSGTIVAGTGTITIPGGSTLVNETLVVLVASRSNDSATADFSAEACASLVSITEAYDAGTTSGSGGGLGVWYGEKAVAGAVGDITFTAASTASRCYMVLGFRPATAGGAQSLTGTLFTEAPTFPTGAITATRNLAGVLFTKAPTFNTGTITAGAVSLTGTLFTKAPTFPTGAVSLGAGTQALTGILFAKAPTFPTGTITAGVVSLTGVLFTKAPTFPAGVVAAGGSPQALTGTLFIKAPTFPTGTITAGAVSLNGVLFTQAPTFPVGAVALAGAPQTLNGILFTKAPTFPTGTIGISGTIFGNLFTNSPVFFTGSMSQPGPTFWSKNPVGFVKIGPAGPSPWGTELSGQPFLKPPTFPVGAVS